MNTIATITTIAAAALTATASVTPFTEDFESGDNNWTAGSLAPVTWNAAGALDGSAYISASADLNTAGPFGLTLLRGQDNNDASGDAFVGNYLSSGITTVEFDFRHNAGIDLDIALRIASSDNNPGLAVQTGELTASGQWVRMSFDLSYDNPLVTLGGFPSLEFYEEIMSQIGNVQVTTLRPDGLSAPLIADFDLDNVSISTIPAPSTAAMLGLIGLTATRCRR